jgi:hypothetical protein
MMAMQGWRVVVGVVLIGLGTSAGYLTAQDRGGAGRLTAQDRLDIQDLYWTYAHGQNFADARLFASAFAEDGVFRISPTRAAVGRDQIAALIAESFAGKKGDSGRRHWQNSWRITPSPEGAQGRVYWLVFDIGKGAAVPGLPVDGPRGPEFRSTGVYEDVYVKTPDGWRIKSRTLNWDEARSN